MFHTAYFHTYCFVKYCTIQFACKVLNTFVNTVNPSHIYEVMRSVAVRKTPNQCDRILQDMVTSDPGKVWPDATLPFAFDSSVSK